MSDRMIGKTDILIMEQARTLAREVLNIGTRVGCVLVDRSGNVVGKGYNFFMMPNGYNYSNQEPDRIRSYVVHAEMIALLSARSTAITAYCTLAPCFNCLKHLCYAGVRQIIYDECLGYNKVFSSENAALFADFLTQNKITLRNLYGVPFLEDVKKSGYLCEK